MEHILSLKNYEFVCGVCLKNAECLLNITTKVSLGISLYDMINYAMGIKINNFVDQSVKVCSDCMPEILTAFNLFRKLKSSKVAMLSFIGSGGRKRGRKPASQDSNVVQIIEEITVVSDDEEMSDILEDESIKSLSETEEVVKEEFTIDEEGIMFLDSDTAANSKTELKTEAKAAKSNQTETTRVFCCYCNSFQDQQFIRHLETFHKDESDVFEYFASKFTKKRTMLLKGIKERGEKEYQTNKNLYDEDGGISTPSTSRQNDSQIKKPLAGFCKFCRTENTDLALHLTMRHRDEPQVIEYLMFSPSTAMSRELLEALQREGRKYCQLKWVFCIFCKQMFRTKCYTSHIEETHSDDPEVKQYLSYAKNSRERKVIMDLWRQRGLTRVPDFNSQSSNGTQRN